MDTSRRYNAIGLLVTVVLIASIFALPAFAAPKKPPPGPPNSSPKCLVQVSPSSIKVGQTVTITVQIVSGINGAVYTGLGTVDKPGNGAADGGTATFGPITTDAFGNGVSSPVIYPTGFTGGTPTVKGVYTIIVVFPNPYSYSFGTLTCSAQWRVK